MENIREESSHSSNNGEENEDKVSYCFNAEAADNDELFYFESDHLALKGNKDYHNLMGTIIKLEAQRAQAIKDYDELALAYKKAMQDPIGFVSKLQNGQLPSFPLPFEVPDVPLIDWSKYNVSQPDFTRPQTRHGNQQSAFKNPTEKDDSDKILVRGRVFDQSKPETFNQLWTVEEQKRLEELLTEYPPEEIEMRRWTKIANALGNRTPKQVASRVQKYFIKLKRTGLPIPGRGPKFKTEVRKTLKHRNNAATRKSTFFPHEDPSFFNKISSESLNEDRNDEDSNSATTNFFESSYVNKQFDLLREIKSEKKDSEDLMYRHLGFKCYVCDVEPLKGTRWHCDECVTEVNLCSDCVVAQIESEDPIHSPNHKLTPFKAPKYSKVYDSDYHPQNFNAASYNYLDPNFLPE